MEHLELVTPPATEPITLAEAKLHLRLEIDEDDAIVTSLIQAARLRAETLLRSTLIATTFDLYLDAFPFTGGGYYTRSIRQQGPGPGWLPTASDAVIRLQRPPIVSVTSIKYYDSTGTLTTLSPSTYVVSTGNGARVQPLPGYAWPLTRQQIDAVIIRYVAGNANAAAVPENVKAAMKLMVGHWYEHREEVSDLATYPVPNAVDALLSATDPGIYS